MHETARLRAAALALLVLATPAAVGAQAGPFTVDHALDMESVSDPQISPDGSRVLYTRATLDWTDNERDRRIWIADADGTDARYFTGGEGDRSPRWSPDGRWVAFLRAPEGEDGKDAERQLFLIRTDGGEAVQLTYHPTEIDEYEWTRDSRRIVFVAPDSLTDEDEEAREAGADALFVNEGPHGQRRGRYSNLWWVPVRGDSAAGTPITRGERIIGDFAVAPDGDRIAFTYRTENRRNDQNLSEIALVDVEGGPIRTLTENAAPESNLAWSPDGNTLSFVAPDLERWALDQGNLYALDLAGGEARLLYGDEQTPSLDDYAWAPDGRTIHFAALDRTRSDLYALDVATGSVRRLSEFDGVLGSPSFSADHRAVAYTLEAPTWPEQVYTATLPAMDPVQVTDVNREVRTLALAEPEVVRWRSRDGLEIEGILYTPPGRAGAGAMVLEIHGGPAGVFTRQFDTDAQVLAANGYAVLQPNVRGSSGYGDALLRGNMRDIGGRDYEDLMTGVDAMIERGVAHPDSLAVKGWSYGGILGGMTIARTDRFRAASLGAMVADWPGEFGVGFNFDVVRWYLGGDPWSNRELWLERSAYWYADEIETPTILFHGAEDTTDTPGQSMNFHAALLYHDVPTRYILFPREPHGIQEPRHQRTRIVEELRWFERWVRGNEDWEAPERPEAATAEVATDEHDRRTRP